MIGQGMASRARAGGPGASIDAFYSQMSGIAVGANKGFPVQKRALKKSSRKWYMKLSKDERKVRRQRACGRSSASSQLTFPSLPLVLATLGSCSGQAHKGCA